MITVNQKSFNTCIDVWQCFTVKKYSCAVDKSVKFSYYLSFKAQSATKVISRTRKLQQMKNERLIHSSWRSHVMLEVDQWKMKLKEAERQKLKKVKFFTVGEEYQAFFFFPCYLVRLKRGCSGLSTLGRGDFSSTFKGHYFEVTVSNWILASCMPHKVTSGRPYCEDNDSNDKNKKKNYCSCTTLVRWRKRFFFFFFCQ